MPYLGLLCHRYHLTLSATFTLFFYIGGKKPAKALFTQIYWNSFFSMCLKSFVKKEKETFYFEINVQNLIFNNVN